MLLLGTPHLTATLETYQHFSRDICGSAEPQVVDQHAVVDLISFWLEACSLEPPEAEGIILAMHKVHAEMRRDKSKVYRKRVR